MAEKKDNVVEVVHSENADLSGKDHAKWLKEQDEAYLLAKATGHVGVWVDPTRDQEPDIAPELGVAPHPELANPAPPASSFSGRALNPDTNSMVLPVEEKEELAKDATEAFNEALQEREEKLANLRDTGFGEAAPMRVVVVEEEKPAEGVPDLPADESPKAVNQSPGDQLGQSFDKSDDDK